MGHLAWRCFVVYVCNTTWVQKKNTAAPSEGSDGNGGLGHGARSDAQSFQSRTQPNSGIQHGGLTLRGRGGGGGRTLQEGKPKAAKNNEKKAHTTAAKGASPHAHARPPPTPFTTREAHECNHVWEVHSSKDGTNSDGGARQMSAPTHPHLSIALACLPCSASISGGVGSWSLSPFEHDSAKTRVGAVHGTALRWRYQASMAPPYVSSSLQAHWQQPTRTPQQFPAWTAIGRQQVILFRSLRPLPLSLRL